MDAGCPAPLNSPFGVRVLPRPQRDCPTLASFRRKVIQRQTRGFTLRQLLVVLIIIGLLSGVITFCG